MKDYFLDPEEMIALYNQITIESILRKTPFEVCLRYYIENYINNIIPIKDDAFLNRFRNGLTRLNIIGKGKLWYTKTMDIDIKTTLEQSLEKLDSDVDLWSSLINRQLCNGDLRQIDLKLENYMQYMKRTRKNILQEFSK